MNTDKAKTHAEGVSTKKVDRSKEVQSFKIPGNNPAMASMSVFAAKLFDQIMVKNLGKALEDKLTEFAESIDVES